MQDKILFLGDFLYDYQDIKEDILRLSDWIKKNQYKVILNLEAPLIKADEKVKKRGPHLVQSSIAVDVLEKLNVIGVTLANNHIMDYGEEALKKTISILDENNIWHIGAGLTLEEALAPVEIQVGNQEWIVFNFGWNVEEVVEAQENKAGCAGLNKKNIMGVLDRYSNVNKKKLMIFHWGFEYNLYPMPKDICFAHQLIDSGIDLIIGHHPHNTQPYEIYNDKKIYYSLGNFYFGSHRKNFNLKFKDKIQNRCDYGAGVIVTTNSINHVCVYYDKSKDNTQVWENDMSNIIPNLSYFPSGKEYVKLVRKTKRNITPVLTGKVKGDYIKMHILFMYYNMKGFIKCLMKKIKVLIIPTLGLSYEGITSVIYNYISYMNCQGLEFGFISFLGMDIDLKKRFECFGQIFLLPKRKRHLLKYICLLFKLLRKNKYDVIHVHGNSGTMIIEVLLAKLTGVKKIIVHGHSTECNHEIINKIFNFMMLVLSDEWLACSPEAGKFLYGKRNFVVLNNAIDLQKYQYDEQVRFKCREEFCVKDELLIGHIGNFYIWKNHTFLIDVFNEYHKVNEKSKLLLVSNGPLLGEMKQKVKKLKLENDVIFAVRRADVEKLYQAMDIFVFPSLWEGLGLVAIEAQVAGLPVLASTNVPIEAGCTDLFEQYELEEGAAAWAKKIERILSKENDRNKDRKEQIGACGYDIERECEKLRKIYLGE